MKGDGIPFVTFTCFGKFLCDLPLSITENYSGLTLSLGLRLHRHRVL